MLLWRFIVQQNWSLSGRVARQCNDLWTNVAFTPRQMKRGAGRSSRWKDDIQELAAFSDKSRQNMDV